MTLHPDNSDSHDRARRQLLATALAVPVLWLARRVEAAAPPEGLSLPPERKLMMVNTHTGEFLSASYCREGQYCPDAMAGLNRLLRDHRSGECGSMDPGLFDLLHELAHRAGKEPRYEIISGYRSAASNRELRAHSSGVARHSLHMEGKAIDVRLEGLNCARLRDLAMEKARGGVGYYRKSDFVHLDTGRFRFWRG